MAIEPGREVECFSDRREMVSIEAERVVAHARHAVSHRGRFLLALSGNPEGDLELNRRQAERLHCLSDYLSTHGRGFMVELLDCQDVAGTALRQAWRPEASR
jgi:hypothetical protein